MKTTIYLIRHGQTEWNAVGRMQGRLDSPLTEVGVDGATQLAAELPSVDAVYSSPSGRALETAHLLFESMNILCDDRLMEINLGDWEGRFQEELDRNDSVRHSNFWNAPHQYESANGESFAHVAERAASCLNDLATRHVGEVTAIVSHTTVIRSMLFSIEKRSLADFWSPPAIYPSSLSEIEIVGGVLSVIRFGCTAHHAHTHDGVY